MSYFFTNNFRKALFDNPSLMAGASFKVRLLRSAPSLSSPAAASWLQASTMAELTSFIGWEEVTGIAGYPSGIHTQPSLTVRRDGINNYVLLDQYLFDNLGSEVRIEGLAIEYASGPLNGIANSLIFVTNTPVGTFMNLDPGDILTSNQDLKLGLSANRWLLAWADTPVVDPGDPQPDWTSLKVIEGPLAFLFSPPLFESSNTLHVWLYPQRANMIANPSFEYDNSQWAPVPTRVREAAFAPILKGTVANTDALLTLSPAPAVGDFYAVASDPVAQDYPVWEYMGEDPNDDLAKWTNHGAQTGKGWAGKFTQTGTNPLAIESNVWETRLGYDDIETWSLQLMAKGTGRIKLGLVFWDIDYRNTGVDWGEETWDLVPDAWVHCTCVRYGPQAHTAMLRIEAVSGLANQEITLDRVLAERGALKEYPYFDGDEHFGAADDFSWYGGAGRRGVSYSMWYGGRRAVIGRMFATPAVHEGELLTDVDVMAAGMVYDWVPAGVTVIPHLDVFYPTDLHGPLPPRRPTTLPPLGPDDPLGVDDPWTPESLPQGLWVGSTVEIGVAGASGAIVHGVRPTVTINKGAGQADPSTESINVVFDVVFSEPVTGFNAADVIVGGTATFPAGGPTINVTGSGALYTVAVSGMITDGTVTATIPANAALSATADRTQASTSTDNNVDWHDPLKQTGWWGIGFQAPEQYSKELGGAGRVKLAGAAGNGAAGGALDVAMPLGVYVVSIGESVIATPNTVAKGVETWGYGGWGGRYAIYGGGSDFTMNHGGGRTELRTASNRSSAVLIAPGGGGNGTNGGAGAGGFPSGLLAVATGSTSNFSGMSGTGGTPTAAGNAGLGYHQSVSGAGCSGESGDTGSGLGAGGRGGNGIVDFASGDGGGGGGAGKHGGGGGAGGDGDNSRGGGGGSGDVSNAAATYGTYTGVCSGMGLAAMQVRQQYTDRVRQYILSDAPRTFIPAEEAIQSGCIVVSDVISGKPFFDREVATIFDGVLATPTQLFQGHTMGGRGAMHVSRIASQDAPDFQMPAVDAASGFFWNPPAFNAGIGWAIEWTQQTIAGNADGPGTASVVAVGNYGQATANQIPWKVSATATTVSLSVATTALTTVAVATGTFASKPTTQFTRYGISYDPTTDTFSFYRSNNTTTVLATTQTRAASGIPTTGQWNAQTWRPLMFSSVTANAEARIQDVALFDHPRSQAQFTASFIALSDTSNISQTWTGSQATIGVSAISATPTWAIYIPQTWAGGAGAAVGVSAVSGQMGAVYEFADSAFHDVTVPAGSTSAVLEVWGAGGAANGANGNGAYAKGTISGLTPGEVLRLTPGGQGVNAGAGGFNGGGACTGLGGSDGYGGHGASDIRRGGTAIANRVIVGGGGGGGSSTAGGTHTGGDGGYPNGTNTTAVSGGGTGGTQTAGGTGGNPGLLGVGATSPSGPGGGRGGGGGGGGYWGGGSGISGFGVYSGGGGGSSYVDPALTNVTTEAVGTWTSTGKARVTFVLG